MYIVNITIYTTYECTILNSRNLRTDSLWSLAIQEASFGLHLERWKQKGYSAFASQMSNFNEQNQCHQASQILQKSGLLPLSKSNLQSSSFPPLKVHLYLTLPLSFCIHTWLLTPTYNGSSLAQGHHLFLHLNSIKLQEFQITVGLLALFDKDNK